jgi:dimethylhistidine N-methyltransferase
MQLDEYYLPESELEILKTRAKSIASLLPEEVFDVIELGAGDGSKTVHFLKELIQAGKNITYYPVDISPEALALNRLNIGKLLPGLTIHDIAGDYFETLHRLEDHSPKMILFMGSNIGNYENQKAIEFLALIRENMHEQDLLLVGIDLRKNPKIILDAYNDQSGVTKRFNLNILERINRELGADLQISQFDHYPFYEPISGIAYSYLISLVEQSIHVGEHTFYFQRNEPIRTEVSQKYSVNEIERLGERAGFTRINHFFDSREYFTVSVFRI